MVASKHLFKQKYILGWICIVIAILPLAIHNINFHHVMILLVMYAALGQAWNIITGFTGQTSFGHAAFFGIGAYTSSVLFWRYMLSPWVGMLLGAVIATTVAFLVSYPCFKLKGHYFAIATLAIGEIIQQLFVSWEYVEGATGISLPVMGEGFLQLQFHRSKLPYFYIVYFLFILVLVTAYLVEHSKMGYYLKAIRESHEVSEAIGINPTEYKVYAMLISAFLTSIFGSFYASYILYIDPFMVFSLPLSMRIVLLTVLGGLGTLYGPIIGAAVLIPLSEYTRIFFGGTGKGIDLIIFGFLVVAVACYQPKGIVGLFQKLFFEPSTAGGGKNG
ncbi:branched-chain amino acid transport system permease protein [Geosporobacter subterraneus DSM 17957]|uniref:Branched-chain amino acid transport system permease protein n=1 Tax=Geosporobacter subterraneus DSM 17957 TaxID=1121919 RepID=A0A1M6D3W7_9FIRM|nr:branched-chain amino acid ABC transporter permease [Geosporobacter subterraneus]SHI67985.1 branched-chain amino acid transport system permease protein [Geosporobacter subterraneus DSM 17957]